MGIVAALLEDDTIGDGIWYLGLEECEMTFIRVQRIAKALASTGGGRRFRGTGNLPNLKYIQLYHNMFPSDSMDALALAFGDKLVEISVTN